MNCRGGDDAIAKSDAVLAKLGAAKLNPHTGLEKRSGSGLLLMRKRNRSLVMDSAIGSKLLGDPCGFGW
jgi:hypothetical protein